MWYLYFATAVVCHLGISFFLSRRFRSTTAFCSVPKAGTVEQCRALAEAVNAQQGTNLQHRDFMVFHTTTTEKCAMPSWVLIYFAAGLVALVVVVVGHCLMQTGP
jgi:hypothetical protein